MKFTLSWLKRHLDTTATAQELAEKLTALGLELESLEDPRDRLKGFRTAEIVEADKHPNADRLKLCKVSTGDSLLQVVCGAPNARQGLKVVLATPGVVVPVTGEALKKGKVRDVESQGMMCSWRELLMGEDDGGIIELPADTPVGIPLVDAIADRLDPLFDIAVTPNRADCLGVRGVARDLAAAGMGTLTPLATDAVMGAFPSPVNVRLDFPADSKPGCPLFIGRVIRGVTNGESPAWLKALLEAVGVRPISLLVDITNFLTLDLNRPLHVFDVAKLQGGLTVRFARAGESLTALNGKVLSLRDGEDVVIADDTGPLSLGGVMGGESSGVSATTTDVFLEAALFDPLRIARTGRAHTLESDARYRFERGLDPAFVQTGLELATALILALAGGTASDIVVAGTVAEPAMPIAFRPARVAQLGGVDVAPARSLEILAALGGVVQVSADGAVSIVPPSWRGDITAEHDLVEEVLRLNGYDAIPVLPMPRPEVTRPVLTANQKRTAWLRRALAVRGLAETVTWSFLPTAQATLFGGGQPELILANPIASDLDAMRPSLLPNLLSAVARNSARALRDVGLFEIGPRFDGGEPKQQTAMAAGVRAGKTGPRHWDSAGRAVDVFDAKADALAAIAAAGGPSEDKLTITPEAPSWYHPGRSGAIKLGMAVLAWFGEIHPTIAATFDLKGPVVGFELVVEAIPLPKAKPTKSKGLLKASPFQPLERDFAFVVDASVSAEKLLKAVRGADKVLISDVLVFDQYLGAHVGEGKKSLALQVTLQPQDKTLTDAELDAVSAKITAAVAKATGGVLRG